MAALEKTFVPPIKIQGIKTRIVPLIQEYAPSVAERTWIEPFMGSGVVGFNLAPVNAIFADTNPHIIAFYNQIKSGRITARIVREFLEEEGRILSEKDSAYYYEVRERFNKNHDTLDFLFLNRSCFNGMIRFNKNLGFNVPYGHKPQRFSRAYITKIVNQAAHIEELLKNNNWTFLCQSFEKTIQMAGKNDFIYCDPPYLGRHVDYYDSWDESMEMSLRDALVASGTLFMLSTWDHTFYRQNESVNTVWKFCHKYTQEHFYHVGAKEANRHPVTEAVLTNYPKSASDAKFRQSQEGAGRNEDRNRI